MPVIGQRDGAKEDIGQRMLELRASSLNVDARTINADVATETPVPMIDWQRMEMVPEILVTDGAILPRSGQVPFLDSHNRSRVADQLGSARGIEVRDNKLVATLHFSEAATNEFMKVREGHVTDVSAGYEILKRVYVPAGESKALAGRSYTGPANVVTKWRLREVSLTPIGADAQAKLRGLDPAAIRFESDEKGKLKMNEALRALLVSRGMKAELTDDQAQVWLIENRNLLGDPPDPPDDDPPASDPPADTATEARNAVRAAIAAERAERVAFVSEVDSLCELAGLIQETEVCRSLPTVAAVRTHLQAVKAKAVPVIGAGVSARLVGNGFDNLVRDMGAALSLRSIQDATGNADAHERILPKANRPKGADTFRHAGIYDMAHEYVQATGINTRGLTREQIAICAMFGPETAGISRRDSDGAAYSTTGSFANITLDAQQKSMQVGYSEAPTTWEGPMRRGASVADFKNINRVRMGSVANLPVWNDNDDPTVVAFTDGKESYAVESRSVELNFSYRLLVNDDMSALGRAPALMGAAAARTVNALAWSIITANGLMSDAVALFSTATGARKRANLTTGSATPTNLTIQTMKNQMRQMRGENTPEGNESQDILNLTPRYIVGPGALDTTIMQLVQSVFDPVASTFQIYNPSRNMLIPIIEPLLDVDSATAWYLFADPSTIDTVEVTFLQGQETPVVRTFQDNRKLSYSSIILQTFGAKALNHRGIIKHAGA